MSFDQARGVIAELVVEVEAADNEHLPEKLVFQELLWALGESRERTDAKNESSKEPSRHAQYECKSYCGGCDKLLAKSKSSSKTQGPSAALRVTRHKKLLSY